MRGLLSFFHGYSTHGEYDCDAHVFYFPDAPRGLAPLAPSKRREGNPKVVGIVAPLALLLPLSKLVPLSGTEDRYRELYDAHYHELYDGELWLHGLFGFERPLEHEARDHEEVLLRLDACGVRYDFVEAACAYYFVPREDLARADFSKARLYEGASI